MPTVTVGNRTADTYSGTEDARLWSNDNALMNFGGETLFAVAKYASTINLNSLIKFSGLSNITGPITVTSATLYITKVAGDNVSQTFTLQRLLRNWVEGTQNGASHTLDTPNSCCWNEYGDGNNFTTPGGMSNGNDRSATITATGNKLRNSFH